MATTTTPPRPASEPSHRDPTEEPTTGSFAGEVAARIAEKAFWHLDAPVARVTCLDTPVPYAPALEELYLPNAEKVAARARELVTA